MKSGKSYLPGILLYAGCLSAQEAGPDRLTTVNPSYDLINFRPAGFEPKVTAIALRPDGKLVIATVSELWERLSESPGTEPRSLYLMDRVQGEDSGQVTVKKIAGAEGAAQLIDPLGIAIVDGAYYVTDKDKLLKLEDTDGDEVIDKRTVLAEWPWGRAHHEFAFGPVYQDGFFYVATSVQLLLSGSSLATQSVDMRGAVLRIPRSGGTPVVIAGGLRTPNGLGFGPRGELFVTDNQGSWLSSSKLINIREGRTYGHRIESPAPRFQDQPVSPPVAWLPHNEIAMSPGEPVFLTSGPYAGQMAYCDLIKGGIKRVFLEEVNGEYQGAVMPLSGGLEGDAHRIALGPDGSLYVGGLSTRRPSSSSLSNQNSSLQRLKPNGKAGLDLLAVRSLRDGMELEFTGPIAADYDTTGLQVRQWEYAATVSYGGPKVGMVARAIRSRHLSPDRKFLALEIEGLKAGMVTHIRANGVRSEQGSPPYVAEAWYTLNAISERSRFDFPSGVGDRPGRAGMPGFRIRGVAGGVQAELPAGAESLEIRGLDGTLVAARDVRGASSLRLEAALPGPGLYVGILRAGACRAAVPFAAP